VIIIEKVSVHASDQTGLLHDVSASFQSGKVHVIVGPNGSGKTTLLKALQGDLKPSHGYVTLNGLDPSKHQANEIAKHISYVEADHLDPFAFSVLDVILWGRWLIHKGSPTAEDIRIAKECADKMGLSKLLTRSISSVSTGERKKTHLARSLASQCAIVSWDEPCGPLDLAASLALMGLLKALAHNGQTIIITMHDIALALDYADTMTVLYQGQIKAHGQPDADHVRKALESSYGIQIKGGPKFFCAELPV
jgi:iron complex transport system ATP-binding protein